MQIVIIEMEAFVEMECAVSKLSKLLIKIYTNIIWEGKKKLSN